MKLSDISTIEKAVAIRLAALVVELAQEESAATMAECLDDVVRELPAMLQEHLPGLDVYWEVEVSDSAVQQWKELTEAALRQIVDVGEDALELKLFPQRPDPAAHLADERPVAPGEARP